jgi:hypothetical protein
VRADCRLQIVDWEVSHHRSSIEHHLHELRGAACNCLRLLACGSMVLPVLSVFRFFRSASEKDEKQKEDKVPLRMITSNPLHKSSHEWSRHD